LFLPIGDSPNPERFTPYVTWGIIAINVAVFVFFNIPLARQPLDPTHPLLAEYARMLMSQGIPVTHIRDVLAHTSAAEMMLFEYGYKPGAPELLNLFSSIFLHAGFMHLFGNMLFLFIYGDNVEHQMGRVRYLLMYLITGAIATLSFAFLAGNSMAPLVGASGAISGVLGCYFLMFPRNVVKIFILLFPIFMNVVRVPARLVLGLYVLLDNLLPILIQSSGNVAHGAHLGGFFAGLGIAGLGEYFGWRSPFNNRERPFSDAAAKLRAVPKKATTFTTRVQQAMLRQDVPELLEALKDGDERKLASLPGEQLLEVAVFLKKNGLHEQAIRILKITLARHDLPALMAELYCELGENRLLQGFATAAYQHFLTALDLHPAPVLEQRIRQQLEKIRV
jgi:membrane associated rhomboid family serine protease